MNQETLSKLSPLHLEVAQVELFQQLLQVFREQIPEFKDLSQELRFPRVGWSHYSWKGLRRDGQEPYLATELSAKTASLFQASAPALNDATEQDTARMLEGSAALFGLPEPHVSMRVWWSIASGFPLSAEVLGKLGLPGLPEPEKVQFLFFLNRPTPEQILAKFENDPKYDTKAFCSKSGNSFSVVQYLKSDPKEAVERIEFVHIGEFDGARTKQSYLVYGSRQKSSTSVLSGQHGVLPWSLVAVR